MKNEMAWWIFQRRFDIVFHAVLLHQKNALHTLYNQNLLFLKSSQPFRCFIMLSPKTVNFFVVFFSVKFWLIVSFSFLFLLMLVLLEEVFEIFSPVVLFSLCSCGFVVVVAVNVHDVAMIVAALLSTSMVCTDTVFIFIAGHLFCNNTSSHFDSWLNKESITLSLFLFAL